VRQSIAKYYAPGMRDEAVAEEPAATKSAGKAKTRARPKPATSAETPRKASGPRSDEEKRQQRLIGILVLLWAIIGSALIDAFLIPNPWKLAETYLLTLIVPPLAAAFVYFAYWK
ncbi:MAG TPA: hypothetical protein VML55_10070, partial [Planctomycetaceae bacterium]|nr:hypothetical protein [Planctomycetaceae bacterium]